MPYYYPYYSDYSDMYPDPNQGQADLQQQEPDLPAPTIFEHRPGYQPPPVQSEARDYTRSDAPASDGQQAEARTNEPEQKVADQAPTILVFRDGHQVEIGNYAIQGDTLFNLDGKGPRKIKLSDLDLERTRQLNDEAGNEFRLPKTARG